jgi:hypothetical protein
MRVRAAVVTFVFAAACTAPVMAEIKTVKGEIIDQACYRKDKANVGDSHKDCGLSCAKKGAPLAVVTSTGEVYTITGSFAADKNAKLIEHFAHTVEVTGDVTEKDGKMMIDVTALKMEG